MTAPPPGPATEPGRRAPASISRKEVNHAMSRILKLQNLAEPNRDAQHPDSSFFSITVCASTFSIFACV